LTTPERMGAVALHFGKAMDPIAVSAFEPVVDSAAIENFVRNRLFASAPKVAVGP
jgi:hypothetical protein